MCGWSSSSCATMPYPLTRSLTSAAAGVEGREGVGGGVGLGGRSGGRHTGRFRWGGSATGDSSRTHHAGEAPGPASPRCTAHSPPSTMSARLLAKSRPTSSLLAPGRAAAAVTTAALRRLGGRRCGGSCRTRHDCRVPGRGAASRAAERQLLHVQASCMVAGAWQILVGSGRGVLRQGRAVLAHFDAMRADVSSLRHSSWPQSELVALLRLIRGM